jgi:hypothetical protein
VSKLDALNCQDHDDLVEAQVDGSNHAVPDHLLLDLVLNLGGPNLALRHNHEEAKQSKRQDDRTYYEDDEEEVS